MPEDVTIVDYRAGNLTSVRLAAEKLGRTAKITSDPAQIVHAERLIFPGVGAASAAMDTLRAMDLAQAIIGYAGSGRPMLGICLGAQVILEHSEEGDVKCLGLVKGAARKLKVPDQAKVPHMGWNAVEFVAQHPIWQGVADGSQFYFIHSYAPTPADPSVAIGVTDYHGRFVSALSKDNIVACQFHPERSGRAGLKVLGNFLSWNP
jgi:glutamine amidotransferase